MNRPHTPEILEEKAALFESAAANLRTAARALRIAQDVSAKAEAATDYLMGSMLALNAPAPVPPKPAP